MPPHIRSQRTVDTALLLSDIGVLDWQNALISDVAVKTIRRWRREYRRLEKPRFGPGAGGTAARCPRCQDGELDAEAYAHLLGWYLGDGHIVATRGRVHRFEVLSDAKYPRLLDEIAVSMTAVRPGSRPLYRGRPGCVAVGTQWVHWPCLFPQHGPGRKHEGRIILEPWQEAIVLEHPGRFLRGPFHSDGCRITNWTTGVVQGEVKRYEYPRYIFTNASEDILGLCTWALDLLGVEHRRPSPRNVSVARRASVAVLDRHVGPKS